MAACVFTTLPNELLIHIATLVRRQELASFRASCKLLDGASLQRFGETYFAVRYHPFTVEGLLDLLKIVEHDVFAHYVRKIILVPEVARFLFLVTGEDSDVFLPHGGDHHIAMPHIGDDASIIMIPDEARLLRNIFQRLAPYGHAITVGINTTTIKDGDPLEHSAQLFALKYLRQMVLEAQAFATCTDIVFRIPVPSSPHPIAVDWRRIMFTLPDHLPLDCPWTKLTIEFFTEDSMTTTTGFFEHDRLSNVFRGESTSLYHMRKVTFWIDDMHLEELALTYCDFEENLLFDMIARNRWTLKRLTLHSVSLYRGLSEEHLASDDHGDWTRIIGLISELELDYCSLEYLWDGPLAFVASAFITADDH